ncbi:MAG: IclR family transcriptional regulator [Clostridia bacterium]|nr:IclR family transcriptional regulator [Clostridia bacterium]MBC7345914.1 IclR family transcriptional regulator [Clostridia bacterium]
MKEQRKNTYLAPAVAKAFAILEEVAREPGKLGISGLAKRLELPKSTVHGLVKMLLELEALVQEGQGRGFRLGPRLIELGRQAARNLGLEALAQPYLEALSQELKETVFLGICDGQEIAITAKAESPAEWKVSAPVGTRLPLLAGATAKVFLSTFPEEKVRALLAEAPLPRYTPRSITDPAEFLRQVEEARERGYATDYEEYLRGVNAVCVLLPPIDRAGPAALWVVGFSQFLTPEKMRQAVTTARRTAEKIARAAAGGWVENLSHS